MKNITILFIVYILISFKAYPQTVLIDNGFSLKLDNNDIVFSKKKNSNSTSIDFYKFTDPSKAGNLKLPTKIIYVAIPHSSRPQIKYNSISHKSFNKTIPTIQPEIILANDSTYSYKSVNIPKLQNENILNAEIIDYVWIRDFYCAVVQINSYKYAAETNSIEFDEQYELTFSFQTNYSIRPHSPIVNKSVERNDFTTVIYNSDIAEQFRSTSHKFDSDSSDSWINFQSDYLKLSIYKDGIYRLNKSYFEDRGINATNIDPRTFQLFNYGKEVPIFVNGESDLKFDEGDFIEFHGSKNYSKISNRLINDANSSYNEFMNRYSDTSFFFITWGADLGKRISSHNTINSGAQDTIQYFKELLHVEKNTWFQNFDDNDIAKQTPNWNNNKTWYWDWLGSWNTPRTFTFNTDDLFKNRDASIYFKLTSGGSNIYTAAHIVKLSVNDIKVDSLVVNRFDQVLLKGSINSNNLNEGSNSIKLDLTDNGTNPNFLAYDWFEIEYPKNLSFLNDSANFKIADISTELKKIKISNATKENYIIYKTFPFSKRISDYEIFDGNLFFNDTVSTGDKYCVVSSDKLLLPAKSLIKNFSELSDKSNSTEYLAITHPKFLAGAQDYTNYISENFNVSTKTVLVTDIFDQYGYGYPTPESIKEFLINAYNNWAEPKFSYLTLIGDAAYDYKNYEKQNGGVSLSTNYVPSYGNPTGDYWYGIWDDSNFSIPQMKIGRLPIHNITDLEFYKSKIKNNIEQPYDSWNKKYLFFSGGETEADINQLKAANESVISRSVNSSPLFGNYWHFYKTVNPQSDFGPYTPEVFQNAINSGGVFISYLGHSGAALWDNSINSVLQLENKVNRNPLITDFGCSTNKFAEPDIVCFGEKALFENGGQSLGYIGNSSLGFFTNALNAPTLFYKNLILDSLHEVGSAHLKSKIDLISKYGYTGFSKVFLSTNILLGDPIVRIKIPSKPNLNISASDILLNSELNESLDSSLVKIIVNNFGTVNAEKLKIKIEENYFGKIINSKELDIPFVQHTDTLNYYIMTKNNPGVHSISVFVDPQNEVDEIYENDNVANLNINVYSQGLRDMFTSNYENSNVSFLNIMNPATYPDFNFNIEVQLSESENFNNITSIIKPSDTLLTKLELNLEKNRRYWYRYKLEESSDFSIEKSFYLGGEEKYLINDQYSFDKQYIDALDYSNHLALSNDSITISVLSAGGNSGANCIIAKDGQNLLSNSISAGIGIVVIDPITIEVDTSIWFTWSNQHTSVQNLADFINTIENGKIVIMGVADDASNNLSTNLINAIKTLGSTKIDSLVFQGSWAIISHKGASPGSVIEKVLSPLDGQVFLDSVFIKNNVSGILKTNLIGPSTNWKNLSVFDSFPNNSSITYRPILISQSDNSEDTLAALNLVNGEAALKNIDAAKYPYIKILAEFEAGDNNTSPALNSLGVDYTSVPELAINYQVVSIEQDTVQQGEDAILSFYIYNVGESRADSFKVQVEVIKSDNSREQIFEQIVDSLGAEKLKEFKVAYNTLNISGERTFSISIDSDNKILELFEDNNFYKVPFYVNEDITNPTVAITFDGNDIIEGEYISSTPKIKIEMSEPSFVPITDTSSISILLNNEKVYYKGNEEILTINYSSSNPKVVVDYTPQLEDGEYELRVFGKDASGNVADSLGLSKSFIVASDAKIMDVYNYPNPMTDETYFTFKLTQIPDEVKIRIFTIAGRLIRKIIINSSELNYDLNKIYWDGLDADGDKIGNGIYIYRVIMDVDGKKQVETSKLAVVK